MYRNANDPCNTDFGFFTCTANYDNIGNTTITDEIAKAAVAATAGIGSRVFDGLSHSPTACVVAGA